MKLEETTYDISGIYKIIFDNDKIYIGRTNSLRRRMIEHIGKELRVNIIQPFKNRNVWGVCSYIV